MLRDGSERQDEANSERSQYDLDNGEALKDGTFKKVSDASQKLILMA